MRRSAQPVWQAAKQDGDRDEHGTNADHAETREESPLPRTAPEGAAHQEEHDQGSGVRDAQRPHRVREEQEGDDQRKSGEGDEQEDAQRPQQRVLRHPRAARRQGQLHEAAAHGLQFLHPHDFRHAGRHDGGDESVGLLVTRGAAQLAQQSEGPIALDEIGQHVHDRIDDAPSDVAADGTDEHGADLLGRYWRRGWSP